MKENKQQEEKHNKLNFLESFTEVLGWLQIFISPFLIGAVIALIIYFSFRNGQALVCAIIIAAAGFIFGIIWATKI